MKIANDPAVIPTAPEPAARGSKSPPEIIAAVDLGSNSFRMVIARRVGDEVRPVDRLREGVRLAECLDDKQQLTQEGIDRALGCLKKFGQRVRDFPQGAVRAVGTNTLRKAKKTERFLQRAEEALGHHIEIVSGQEEARLIYLGAFHTLAGGRGQRLVVDIGGGSTECIVGEDYEPRRAESLYMGCVGYTMEYFTGGRISARRMRRAETAASLELRPVKAEFRKLGWQRAVGCSGTIQAVADILRSQGWSEQGITPRGLEKLRKAILAVDHTDDLALEGLRRDRAKVLPGGVAILLAVFESFQVEAMTVSPGALREGVLYDLVGRMRHDDARDRTIQRFIAQYQVDTAQASRVEATALDLFAQVAVPWKIDRAEGRSFLSWAAKLHEIGLSIAHGGFHKHGAYLIDHSDMPGFSFQDQRMLSCLVRAARRKFHKGLFKQLPKVRARTARHLAILLRLALVLNRSRSRRELPAFQLERHGKKLTLRFPQGWLDRHPLTRADLIQESRYLETAGHTLKLGSYE